MKIITTFIIALSVILVLIFGIIPWSFDISLSSKIFGTIVSSLTAIIMSVSVYSIWKTLE